MMHLDQLPNQRPNEHVVLFLRRHWIALFGIISVSFMLILIPLLLIVLFWDQMQPMLAHPVIGPISTLIGSLYFISIWLFTFIEFTDYYLDMWIVTNERIINIEQQGLFNRTASELDLASVQDTTAEIRGIVQTVLSYGNVFVQTAGEHGRFHFKNIPDPETIKERVNNLVEEDKKRADQRQSTTRKGKVKTVGK